MKIYLDTNIILDFFLNRAKAIDGKQKFHDPKKLEFLMRILDRVVFVTSFLTKAEVFRELVAGQGIEMEEAVATWDDLSRILKWEYIEGFYFDEGMIRMVQDFRIRLRTLMNYEHLFIAVSKNLYFVTGDKRMLESVRSDNVYENIMSYIELRKAFSF